jgi:DNA gyrase subunit A
MYQKRIAEIKEKFGDERRTEITYLDDEVKIKDLIKEEDVVITISHLGYIKRTPADEYRQQRRGGRGVMGGKQGKKIILNIFLCFTTSHMLFFTKKEESIG